MGSGLGGWLKGRARKRRGGHAGRPPVGADDGMRGITVHSQLSLAEARSHLRERVPRRLWAWPGEPAPTVVGVVRDDQLRLVVIRPNARSVAGQFVGRLVEEAAGTRIEGKVRVHPGVVWFNLVWFAAVAVMIVGCAVAAFVAEGSGYLVIGVVAGAALGFLRYVLVQGERDVIRRDRDDIARLLAQALDATGAKGPS